MYWLRNTLMSSPILPCPNACRLSLDLGLHDQASAWAQRLGSNVAAAKALAASKQALGLAALANGNVEAALADLGTACRLFRRAKDPLSAFSLMQAHPQLAEGMPAKVSRGRRGVGGMR